MITIFIASTTHVVNPHVKDNIACYLFHIVSIKIITQNTSILKDRYFRNDRVKSMSACFWPRGCQHFEFG